MSAIRDGRYPIMLDKERHLLYDLNALDMIQERFGELSKIVEAMTGKDGFKNLRYLLTILLREGDPNEEISEIEVGRLIHAGNIAMARGAIIAAISVGNTGNAVPAEVDEDDAKNVETGKSE